MNGTPTSRDWHLAFVLYTLGAITAAATAVFAVARLPLPYPFNVVAGVAFGIATAVLLFRLEEYHRATGSPTARLAMLAIHLTTVGGAVAVLEANSAAATIQSEQYRRLETQARTLARNDSLHVARGWGADPNGNPELRRINAELARLARTGAGSDNALFSKLAAVTGAPFWLVVTTFCVGFAVVLDFLFITAARLRLDYRDGLVSDTDTDNRNRHRNRHRHRGKPSSVRGKKDTDTDTASGTAAPAFGFQGEPDRDPTKQRIVELWQSGITNKAQIGRQVRRSRQYVGKVIAEREGGAK